MSMGGCFIAIKKEVLNEILNKNQSLSNFVKDDNNQLKHHSLEQAWDAMGVLLSSVTPYIQGGEHLEEVDLGETCFYLNEEEVKDFYEAVKDLTVDDVSDLYSSPHFEEAEFYWDDFWKNPDNFEDIWMFTEGLQKFLKSAVEDKEQVLYYIG